MKLRRAMGVAAATAVLAPLALLSAPVAFAEDGDTTTTSATPTDTASDTTSATPTDTTSATPSDTGLPSDSASATDSTSPSASESASTSAEPSVSAEPSDEPTDPDVPFCEDVDKNYEGAKVSADIKGLPGKIVAGDGFHSFELTVTNDAKTTVEGVAFYAEVENYELDESKFLSPYVDLEFKNPETGSWDRIGSDEWAGDYFFYVDKLKAGQSQSVDLRVSIDAKAPAGDAYSFGSGAYLDNIEGQDCIAEGWAQYDFEVLKAGSANPDPGTATPGGNGSKGGSVKKPQGEISDLPTGNLAETGSSSALPVIGLVGGVAVVAGAGAVFAVRRRRAGAGA
ncbi:MULTISPECIES: LAETG motif-containing sortase-dependent surface protein [Streptomyces]|uniref:LPXTG cell wall anchor domain-containing protein n=1 Tax=Streptomyces gilvifuscus TaxID=1550617 RepID=A0ABT5FSB1_9ACTN|nr:MULTISPECIES: LAETG motif-containing sortase-dependent surface protein [Streptomyces]MBK3647620.1 LPXTG cell wall anchor domain-containing protein [Streptomyces sp. MBT33]MDC2955410.1 LPXTG cell wall anchor domain-containing protein [Streptomyces gilvifuscus]